MKLTLDKLFRCVNLFNLMFLISYFFAFYGLSENAFLTSVFFRLPRKYRPTLCGKVVKSTNLSK